MPYEFENITVLVVEDNQPMLDVTKSLLLTFGVGQVIGAKNGEHGFEKYCEYNPDLIIADWMMKPVDGISFTRQVRNAPQSPNQFVPIILMTGFSEKRRVIQARDAGVTEFLVKPFSARDLYRRIAQVIERPRQFVRSGDFFGPDRRRKGKRGYEGPLRREADSSGKINSPFAENRKAAVQEAHEHLRQVREESGLQKGDKIDLRHTEIDMV